MTLRVLTCSERILDKVLGPPQRGLVQSAFESAANLAFANGFLLSLNAAPYPQKRTGVTVNGTSVFHSYNPLAYQSAANEEQKRIFSSALSLMPNGMLLSAQRGNFPFTTLKPGMPVILGSGWLTLEAISCALDCTTCPRWNPRIEPWEVPDLALLKENMLLMKGFCQNDQGQDHDESFRIEACATLEALAERLCGRGPGLTPSGDDFLAGFMAVGWLLYGPQPNFLASCQYVVELARLRTHVLSQCWLSYAAAGDVAQPVKTLLDALKYRDQDQLEQCTRHVLAMGASSGYDLLQGIFYGIDCFSRF